MKIPDKEEIQQIALNHLSDIDFKDFMKIYKNYAEEPFSFLINHTTLPSYNPLRLRRIKTTVSENVKQFLAQWSKTMLSYDLDRQTIKTSALSSGNVSKYKFLIGEYFLRDKEKSRHNQKI